METLTNFLTNQYVVGLLFGVILGLVLYIYMRLQVYKRDKEIWTLKSQLHVRSEREAMAKRVRDQELSQMQGRIENLRITVEELKKNTDREDREKVKLYEQAIKTLGETDSMGKMAWDAALISATQSRSQEMEGMLPKIKRAFKKKQED